MNMNEKNEISNLERYKLDQKNIKRKPLDVWNGKKVYGIDKDNIHMENFKNHQDLIFAIFQDAIDCGDYHFFETERADKMNFFIQDRCSISLDKLKNKSKDNYDELTKKSMNDTIFGI